MARVAARTSLLVLLAIAGGAVLATRPGEPAAQAARDAPAARAGRDADDDAPRAPAADAAPAKAGLVKLDDDGVQKGGIATAAPAHQPFQDRVRIYGSVVALDRMTGLYNSVLTNAVSIKTAQVKLAAAKAAAARAQTLLKSFPTSKAQAETAEAEQALQAAGLDAANAQMDALRNTAVQDWGPVLGAAILARDPLAADLVQRRSSLVTFSWGSDQVAAPPPRLTIEAAGREIAATFVSPATQVDPRIQGASYFYVAPASAALLPGAAVAASVPKGAAAQGFGIPASAVVWQGGKAWVYLRDGAGTFRRRAVDDDATPTPDGGYVVPAASLPHDPALVVSGAQILLSQESRAQIPTDEDDQ